jgi:hypothetical protein
MPKVDIRMRVCRMHNEYDNGEPAKMSSSYDFFSEKIQVDLDDPGIWKAKGVKMDSCHWARLIWAYL